MALLGQILYIMKSEFTSKMVYTSFEIMIIIRFAATALVCLFLIFRNLVRHKVTIPAIDNRISNEEMEYLY